MVVKRYPRKLNLGEHYVLTMFGKTHVVRFIQPTPKGFNFLDVATAKCLLRHHLYVQRDTKNTFWVGDYVKNITKV
jgi:hypothetical protein